MPLAKATLTLNKFYITLKKYNDRSLDVTKLKAFAEDKCCGIENFIDKVKKHCGKRRKCWLPAFSLFRTVFSKAFLY